MSIIDQFGKKQRPKLDPPLPPLKLPPQEGQLPMHPHHNPNDMPSNHRRQMSEAYANAQQQWAELERELQATKTTLASANSHIQVLEESNAILHEEIAVLKNANDKLVRENTVIHTRIATAAEALVNIMKPLPSMEFVEPSLNKLNDKEALEKVEEAVVAKHDEP